MEAGNYRKNPNYTEGRGVLHSFDCGDLNQKTREDEVWRLVDVLLSGGAPWGFTLRGGREHQEPLLITKVEEGSKAAAVSLQVGDELVNINEIPLSGYRQEAICLVKGSHKTLTLVVKRRNEPISRPHSWHSTKFNESQSETAKTQSPPPPVWHTRYDASSSSTDLSTDWEQTNLRRVSDQFSSLGSMDSLEHISHPYPPGQLSPGKSNNSVEHLGGEKRDSAYSSFSTSSGTPDYTLSKSNAASTENMLYKVSQWDSGGKHSSGRNSQSLIEGVKHEDRPGYILIPGASGRDSPRSEEQAGSRHSSSSRASFGPVWHIPEKKKTASPSPPPPPPPVRSDSFAATKVHERGLTITHPEGPDSHVHSKHNEKGIDKKMEASEIPKSITESRRNFIPLLKNDADNFHLLSGSSSHQQLNSVKQYSNTETRQGQPHHANQLHHQWQYNEKSTFYPQPKTTSVSKPQNASGYYSSMQELPTDGSIQLYGANQGKSPSTSLPTTSIDQNSESSGHSRYYCVTSCQPTQPNIHPLSGKPEERKSVAGIEIMQTINDKSYFGHQTENKTKYHHISQQHFSYSKDSNGYNKKDESLNHHKKQHVVNPPTILDAPSPKPTFDDRGSQRRRNSQNAETCYMSYPPGKQSEQRRSLPLQHRELEPLPVRNQNQQNGKICPQTTPMLHSLSMETAGRDNKFNGAQTEESLESKQMRRSDRFATTLRNEIQMRRARLQKSMSAATLTGTEAEAVEEEVVWESKESSTPTSADSSFTSTYKDNLKEAQARVLKATSFRRRDLEPVLLEHPAAEALPNYPSSVVTRKDVGPLPTVSEAVMSKTVSVGGQVTRIGSRKRFPVEKKVKSFSEPDKIHEVGVREHLPTTEDNHSLVGPQKPFETADKPVLSKPLHSIQSCSDDPKDSKTAILASNSEPEDTQKAIRRRVFSSTENTEEDYSAHNQALLEQQRLGTFAEYEARWTVQRKPSETRASGRYRSADNILDTGAEERAKPCFHERSRSSPSADFYGQKIQGPEVKSTEYSNPESKPVEQQHNATRFSDSRTSDCTNRQNPVEIEHYPATPQLPMTGNNLEFTNEAAPTPIYERPTSITQSPTDPAYPYTEDHSHTEAWSGPRKKPPVTQKSSLPKLDASRCSEINPPVTDSQKALPIFQGELSTHCTPNGDADPPPAPAYSPKRDCEQSGKLEDTLQGAVHQTGISNPLEASPPSASSHGVSAEATMDGHRTPSPQFSPQRLSDKPPVALQDEDSNRMESVMESNNNTAGKKVPIKIVHLESVSQKESRQCIQLSDADAAKVQPAPAVTLPSSLGAREQDFSGFCAYTRQRDPVLNRTPAPQRDLQIQGDAHLDMHPLTDPNISDSERMSQLTEQPSCNKMASLNSGLYEDDQKRELLAKDIMGKDKSLADILDQSKRRTTMDLMEGIFPQGEQLLEGAHQRRKAAPKQTSSRSSEERKEEDSLAAAVVTSSTYYSTSAPKAELLIKMKDMQEQEEEDSEDELDIDLAYKKQELIDSLSRKLRVLREARESLQEDILDNNALGEEVEVTVKQVCKPNELDKFRMFVGDLDKVVSLLLSLSGRLARVENALNSLEEDATPEERRTLTEKRKLLIRQHVDAKELKENLDRRERAVYDILASYLVEESMADYEHFVKMKSALIIEQRKLEDKIKLGDEQLKCLMDSLPLEQRLLL